MKWNIDRNYMKDHLLGYTDFQLRQGYSTKDVREALLKYGYDYELVDQVLKNVDTGQYTSKKHKSKRILNEDLYIYLQNLLVDYIKKEMDAGYEIEVIRKALIKYGHHPAMVRRAIRSLKDGTVEDMHPRLGFSAGIILALCLVLVLFFIGFLLLQSDATLVIVVLSFAPALIIILLSYLIAVSTVSRTIVRMTPIISVAVIVILFVIGQQVSPNLRKLSEPGTILLLNVFLGFVCSGSICMFSRAPKKKITVESITDE